MYHYKGKIEKGGKASTSDYLLFRASSKIFAILVVNRSIATSPKVIERALKAGYEPLSFLVEHKDLDREAGEDRKSTRLNSSHNGRSRMPSSA